MKATVCAWALLGATAGAQETAWQIQQIGSGTNINTIDTFGDFDGDGTSDLLMAYTPNIATALHQVVILSGATGARLWPLGTAPAVPCLIVNEAGDMDGDGSPDFATAYGSLASPPTYHLEVWSPARNQMLWSVPGTWNVDFGCRMAGNLDVNGDGRPDFIALTQSRTASDVHVFDNSGSQLYTLPALAFGWIAQSVAAMPDLDGDGCDDFIVGALRPGVTGGVFVVSGRTGSILRISLDLRPGDVLGGAVTDAGDVDRDGVHDYATSSYVFSPLTQIAIFSGATGAVIRSWQDFWTADDSLLGNVDVDLDGIPDLLAGTGGYPIAPNVSGQLRAYSGRDGSILWRHNTPDGTGLNQVSPNHLVKVGVDAGSPYPLIAWLDRTWFSVGRLVAMRTNLPGAGPVSGSACASLGPTPEIGMRVVPGHVRITIADGPPGALAVLFGGPAAQTTFAGVSLPHALDPLGLLGCTAFVAPVVTVPTMLGLTGLDRGYAAVDLPWPTLSSSGHAFAAQWACLDSNGVYAASARHEFRVP